MTSNRGIMDGAPTGASRMVAFIDPALRRRLNRRRRMNENRSARFGAIAGR